MDGQRLNQYLESLRNLFLKQNLSSESITKLINHLDLIGAGEFISPYSWSAKAQIDSNLADKMFYLLATKGEFEIYTVPEFKENLMMEYVQKGLIADKNLFDVQDPDDFNIVEKDQITLCTLYRKVEDV